MKPAKRKEIVESFALLDSDGGGDISRGEIGRMLRELGDNPTDYELDQLWSNINMCTIGDTPSLKFEEFCDVVSYTVKPSDELSKALSMLDPNKTGKIHVGEFRYVLTGGEGANRLSDDQVDEIVKELIVDDNGFFEIQSLFSSS